MIEILREIDPVIGGAWLFTKRDDLEGASGVKFNEPLTKAMADHAVADDHHRFLKRTHYLPAPSPECA